jgi:lipopolysaccharide export system ATP-binding protein
MSLFAHNLQKSFKGKEIVRDVSLHIQRGEVVGLFGPNGAGKTSCFLMIAGLLKPDQGKIFLQDTEVTYWPLYRKARVGMRYLPQEACIFRGMSVEDNLMCALEIAEPRPDRRKEQLEALIEEFHLDNIRHSSALVLSGGERRRVEIARALVGSPSFILLDEPLAGIDPKSIEEIKDLIHHLVKRNMGILVTDHNVKDMLRIVHRAYVMDQGQVIQEGTPDVIACDPKVREIYLGDSFLW